MSIQALLFRYGAGKSDKKRDAAIPLPADITECRNIAYSSHGSDNLLDVYYPEGTTELLPTIVSIHGGGYVYGSKEIYRRYGMDMARRGFAFVNFNYRLAPKWKFPTPLCDTNSVMQWIVKNAHRYHLDPRRIFLVGDSAGAQLASQYAAMWSEPEYAALFQMRIPKIRILALGLNCGMYDMSSLASQKRTGLHLDYLGRDLPGNDPRFRVLESITDRYPPAFITTACHDFLRECAEPMHRFLSEHGVEAQWRCYGREEDTTVGHVFHVNILLPEAVACNDDTVEFFRKYL
jgi:acetyl esterase/lipase